MINEKQIDLLVERLVRRIEEANTYFLKRIGSSVARLKILTPTQAQQLVQILKYGGNYEEIIKEIAKYTGLNIKDIEEIFNTYAKKDRLWSKQFYEYRNIPFEESSALISQRKALTELVKNEMYNFTRTNVLGYTINGVFYNLRDTYNKLLDEALLNVGEGKETFDQAMTKILKDIGGSGLKTLNYESGRNIRLDSAVRMHLKGSLRELHNEQQKIIGEEIGYDGVEISTHSHPAPDHALVQGRQFSNEEFDKFQNDIDSVSYDGIKFPATSEETGHDRRSISQYNCYHYIFSIVLGVSKPEYSNEELQEIIDRNNEKVEIDGKKYTKYECTQLQRSLERKIREQKDIQILAKASGNEQLIGESQQKITQLTHKYHEISKKSDLPTKLERLKVSGYRRTKIEKPKYYKDVTQEWLNNATPNSHEVLDRQFYINENGVKFDVDNDNVVLDYFQEEKDTAIWLENKFGGEIYMNPRINKPDGIESADFFFRNNNWDRKGMERATSKTRAVDNAIKDHKEQAKRFVLDVTNCKLTNKEIIEQVKNTFTPGKFNRDWVKNIIIKRDDKVVKIFEKE